MAEDKYKLSGGGSEESNSLTENKYTGEDLKEMQSWSLERKIQVTQTRIIEWYQKWEGMVYVSFSGGKDSTVLLDITRKLYPEVPGVFFDTGLEYPEIREFVKTFDNITWMKPDMNFRKVIETCGYPVISKEVSKRVYWARRYLDEGTVGKWAYDSLTQPMYRKDGQRSFFDCQKYRYLIDAPFKISEQCCMEMKKKVAKKYNKLSKRKPILALMASESRLRKAAWMKHGCNAFDAKDPKSIPMAFWREQDVLEYIIKYNLPYASVYGDIVRDKKGRYKTTKCDRTGCVFCAYGAHLEKEPNRFQRLKQTHPKLWGYCMKPWDEGGLGMREVLDYIGVKIE